MALQLDNITVIPFLLAHLSQFGLNRSHVHEIHVADLELDVERRGRFADGPACRGGCDGWQAGVDGWFRRWGVERFLGTTREAQGTGVNLRGVG
jgi:hypothetical protein